jgi:hypothetical protein
MPSTLSPTETAEFNRLLKHIVEKDKGFLPDEESSARYRRYVRRLRPKSSFGVKLEDLQSFFWYTARMTSLAGTFQVDLCESNSK